MRKKAFITGITGQDASYLAELLLEKDYEVHGLARRPAEGAGWVKGLLENPSRPLWLHEGGLADSGRLTELLKTIRPDEIYNLAAQSDDVVSQGAPEYTLEINGLGPVRLLEAIFQSGVPARFFQASSSEIFGSAKETPQTEKTPVRPLSPYGHAKVLADGMVAYYRTVRKLYAVSGILFNHESPRRGERFVTRKIAMGLALILAGRQDKLVLGNLESKRDWGYAGDYARAMWLSLQPQEPDDYVIATGENHSIREFLQEAFSYVGLDYLKYVETDPGFLRRVEIAEMRGDSSKARKVLGWNPTVGFRELVRLMVDAELKALGLALPS